MASGLKGLKKEGTRGEGRQGKIGDDSMRSYYHEIMGTEILPQCLSLRVCAYVDNNNDDDDDSAMVLVIVCCSWWHCAILGVTLAPAAAAAVDGYYVGFLRIRLLLARQAMEH